MKKALFLAMVALVLCGCCSVKICDEGGRRMCYIENTGWLLLNCIPIGSGNPRYPNAGRISWFKNEATLENNIKILDSILKNEKTVSVQDVSNYWTEEHVFLILLKRHIRHTSAEMLGPVK